MTTAGPAQKDWLYWRATAQDCEQRIILERKLRKKAMDEASEAQKTVEECQKIIGLQQRRIEYLEEKDRLSENLLRIEAEERNKALAIVAEQQETDRQMAIEMEEEEKRQLLIDEQEAIWQSTGMDWDQQFWSEDVPAENGANKNTTLLCDPCKKCDKKFVSEKTT